MPIVGSNILAGASGQTGTTGSDRVGTYTGKSCLFSGSNEFLNKTWGTTETDADKFTISMWIKRNNTDSGSTQYWLVGAQTGAESNIKIQYDKIDVHLTGSNYDFRGTRVLTDTSAWYHLVFRYDSDESSAGDRFRCYINGELETWATSSTIPSGQDGEFLKDTNAIQIGSYDGSSNMFNGYIAQVVAIDGQSLGPEVFAHQSPDTGAWVMEEPPVAEMIASGGNTDAQISGTQFHNHVFTADGTLTVTQGGLVEYLVIGGGGSGASSQNAAGGGGGAGGYRTGFLQVPKGSYSITVGAGGATTATDATGNDGAASVFHTITASGGGGGGFGGQVGRSSQGLGNGSGGGGGYDSAGGTSGDYGNNGGAGGASGGGHSHSSGGGGGSSGAGAAGGTHSCGAGGSGTASSITGASVTRAGGGGGTGSGSAHACAGGSGGGGAGGASNTAGTAGTVNTGSGGGGGGGTAATAGGAGGSGIVIIRYFNPSSFDFGNNGFLLEFKETGTGTASTSTIGADTSGKTNHLTSNNMVSGDSARIDTPVNNFCTLNALSNVGTVLSEGNLKATADSSDYHTTESTFAVSSGKWYVEYGATDADSTGNTLFGIHLHSAGLAGISAVNYLGKTSTSYAYSNNGNIYSNNAVASSAPAEFDSGDVIAIALDMDANTIKWYKNNNLEVTTTSVPDGLYTFVIQHHSSEDGIMNFGQDSSFSGTEPAQNNADGNGEGDFYYSPPSGYLALCSKNLPDVEIGQEADDLASDYFSATLYTGNTATPRTITGVGFEPGITVTRARGSGSTGMFWDDVRGAGSNKQLSIATEDEEGTDGSYNSASFGFLSAFNSDGFVLTDGSTNGNWVNENSVTFASWNWKLGTAASGTTSGSGDDESYSAQVNTDAGIGLVAYEGNGTSGHTIPHNLNSAPEWIVARRRNSDNAWFTYHVGADASAPQDKYMVMDTNASVSDQTAMWNDTAPSSTMITVGDSSGTNSNGDDYMMWYAHSVDGYSKFGKYTGNNSAEGPFVHCGFSPACVITKRVDSSDHWRIYDNKRHTVNDATNPAIKWNDTDTEADAGNRNIDFLSNGFKIRDTDPDTNASGGTYLFLAWAKTPFKYGNAI